MHPRLDARDILDVLRAIAIGAVALVGLVLAMIGFLDVTRGTPVTAVLAVGDGAAPRIGDTIFVRTVQMYAGMSMEPGNAVEVLENGDGTYPIFWRDLRAARSTITAQFYYSQPGAVADTFAAILAERARAGVNVLLLLDAFGSGPLRQGDWAERLEESGVRIAWLRPLRWYSLHQADHRSHVRAIVIDGEVGYTGGFGLADYWLGQGRAQDEWRETNVRVRGSAAGQLQAAFATTWAEATGRLLTGDAFFPRATFDSVGTVYAGMLHTTPTIGSTPAERFLALTIAGAERRLWIANSYFVPDDDFRRLLVDAARRGVDVRILVPGDRTDVRTTLWAGRRHYGELLRGGVRIWEYGPTNMHAKTFVVDGRWSSIGSLNFDNRSLAFNDESTLVVDDLRIGRRMEEMFEADLDHSTEVTIAEVEERPLYHRLLAFGASLLARVL